jgi:hypothetical protein
MPTILRHEEITAYAHCPAIVTDPNTGRAAQCAGVLQREVPGILEEVGISFAELGGDLPRFFLQAAQNLREPPFWVTLTGSRCVGRPSPRLGWVRIRAPFGLWVRRWSWACRQRRQGRKVGQCGE